MGAFFSTLINPNYKVKLSLTFLIIQLIYQVLSSTSLESLQFVTAKTSRCSKILLLLLAF